MRYDVEVLISDDAFDNSLFNRLTEQLSQLSNLAETISVVSQERRERAAARNRISEARATERVRQEAATAQSNAEIPESNGHIPLEG